MTDSRRSVDDILRSVGIKRRLRRGGFLFRAGEPAAGFYRLVSGEVRVYQMDEKGREVEVVRLRPGDFLGEAVSLASGVFPSFAQATRDSEVLWFDKRDVLAEVRRNPAAALFFIDLLARKCLALSARVEALGLMTVRQRLVHFLLSRCSGEETCLVELGMRKVDLARRLGTVGETLSRTLRQMEDEGLIKVEGSRIRLLDCPRLRSRLDR